MQHLFLPQSCEEILIDVKYLGMRYACQKLFKPSNTEMGPCYVSNSLFSYDMMYDKLPFKYTIENHEAALEFRYRQIDTVSFMLYIHSPEELPYPLMPNFRLRKSGAYMHYSLNTIEVFNYPDVNRQPMKQRECRYPFENITNDLPYSFTNCFLQRRIQTELKFCNCTIPTSPRESKTLSMTKQMLSADEQPCMQSCYEMEINIIGENIMKTANETDNGNVRVEIMNIPTNRYERRVSRTNLDFVVALGGVGGLFFGISLLSIIEVFYFCLHRSFTNYPSKN
ncbi:sodium channel protein Nach-like [Malaya genurostris]|uniref:sodium channel protein Nach-like n=1 Tax=Malaya genurostris TaxID=325434 RepID=UPI0026F3D2FE|nr:sodium channel protein Nach-like [Malaya genurostris]